MTPNRPLAPLTWLRVGGPAEMFFQPKDLDDLVSIMAGLDPATACFPLGLGSNLIVRDGGIRGAIIRLGRGFQGVEISQDTVTVGAAVPDAQVAKKSADAGLDLTFLRTIPGAMGGGVRMNAGCYGSYVADHFVQAQAVTRQGEVITLKPSDMGFGYRTTDLPPDLIITEVTIQAERGSPQDLNEKMADQVARRDATQPTKDRTAGSTFRNPAGYSSTGKPDDTHELKAWKVIDTAGMRGATLGGAQMSEKHSNFLVNTGTATA
ncbi:MAG: UDP-N-acetylmuramate dehydrogenase, partial [Pseudomonadota bacterium]